MRDCALFGCPHVQSFLLVRASRCPFLFYFVVTTVRSQCVIWLCSTGILSGSQFLSLGAHNGLIHASLPLQLFLVARASRSRFFHWLSFLLAHALAFKDLILFCLVVGPTFIHISRASQRCRFVFIYLNWVKLGFSYLFSDTHPPVLFSPRLRFALACACMTVVTVVTVQWWQRTRNFWSYLFHERFSLHSFSVWLFAHTVFCYLHPS